MPSHEGAVSRVAGPPPSPTFLIAPLRLLLENDEVLIEVYVLFIQFSLNFAELHTVSFIFFLYIMALICIYIVCLMDADMQVCAL